MRAALIICTAVPMLLFVGACDDEAVRGLFGPRGQRLDVRDTIYCLGPDELHADPADREGVWARYQTWTFCEKDPMRGAVYLDRLVAQEDPQALHEKGRLLKQTDRAESARLLRRARQLGWRESERRQR